MSTRLQLKDFPLAELRERFAQQGFSNYRANQVLEWIYRHGVEDADQMTNLSLDLREWLRDECSTRAIEVKEEQISEDGTRKYAMATADGKLIEAVMIPEARRNTLCISTQVGCPLACDFCATGKMGLVRNLSTAEIVDQVCRAQQALPEEEDISNIVFMGMGEPLLNLPAVERAIRILTEPRGMALAPRRITVSTAGVVPKIAPLLEIAPINLAVSLHATRDEVRDVLVPINKKFPIAVLLDSLRANPNVTRKRPVFIEYTLLEGVNDSLDDARRLPGLLEGIPCKLNLIPANPHEGSAYRAPAVEVMDRFAAAVHDAGMRVTLRRARGSDIDAACGQLATQSEGSA
jgi:23S rRNA (adenine2503-C2)-methyltransferase